MNATNGQSRVTLEDAFEALKKSEAQLRTVIDALPALAWCLLPDGSVEFFNQQWYTYTGLSAAELCGSGWKSVVHADDIERLEGWWRSLVQSEEPGDTVARFRRFDGKYRWLQVRVVPVRDEHGSVGRWCGINIEKSSIVRSITDAIRQSIVVFAPDGTITYANRVALEQTGLTIQEMNDEGKRERAYHPDDIDRFRAERHEGLLRGAPFEHETRVLQKGGQYRWYLVQYNPLKDEQGRISRWYATATDIDDRKRSEERLRQSEREARQLLDLSPMHIVELGPDGSPLYENQAALDYYGITLEEWRTTEWRTVNENMRVHPQDAERMLKELPSKFRNGFPFEAEVRLRRRDGQYRWFHFRLNPMRDDEGRIKRWYAAGTDIEDRKVVEQRLQDENVALREEIDRSSMFEEIVGSCESMRQLLKQVAKVAPSDATVLLLGETGTGKELIARALHRRSKRAARAFIRVNCAAIPQSLIASELFGHEKGAFTGALQRRAGRFESADGGTLFLDEIGDLPMETQIALLRVLQEREFERVGSNHPISVDVRLIAATNRDLAAAVAAGTFRQDLFYRLNVVPIAVPPLRERAADIPLLVEYLVGRYAKAARKRIRHINKQSLEQLTAYNWPGNIRELQNVVERAVILSETDTFFVEESWLKREPAESRRPPEGRSALADGEVEMIEDALAECHGRISGPLGAAAKLGIPRQTLESKIKRLGINKYGLKRQPS
jgi:formate hydrogenlyase transcriptional activator